MAQHQYPLFDDEGRELPDPVPLAAYLDLTPPEDPLHEYIRREVFRLISQAGQAEGFESFEESDDFELYDDLDDFSASPYELTDMQEDWVDAQQEGASAEPNPEPAEPAPRPAAEPPAEPSQPDQAVRPDSKS